MASRQREPGTWDIGNLVSLTPVMCISPQDKETTATPCQALDMFTALRQFDEAKKWADDYARSGRGAGGE